MTPLSTYEAIRERLAGLTGPDREVDAMITVAAQVDLPAPMGDEGWPDALHPSHKKVRESDASSFDMICDDCGATDMVIGGWGNLRKPCRPSPASNPVKEG